MGYRRLQRRGGSRGVRRHGVPPWRGRRERGGVTARSRRCHGAAGRPGERRWRAGRRGRPAPTQAPHRRGRGGARRAYWRAASTARRSHIRPDSVPAASIQSRDIEVVPGPSCECEINSNTPCIDLQNRYVNDDCLSGGHRFKIGTIQQIRIMNHNKRQTISTNAYAGPQAHTICQESTRHRSLAAHPRSQIFRRCGPTSCDDQT